MNEVTFRGKASSVLLDNYGIRKVDGQRSGRWLGRNIALISTGNDRIFCKGEKRKFSSYAVVLLIDCSGSMRNGSRVEHSTNATFEIYRQLKKIGVKLLVQGFNAKANLIPFDLSTETIKSFQAKVWNEVGGDWHHGSHDYMAIRRARDLLIKEKDFPGKIILTFSDGQPACDYAPGCNSECLDNQKMRELLKNEIKISRKIGIQVLALGIQTEAVKPFYGDRQSDVIYKTEDIYSSTATLLSKNLKRG